jgi:hypothetical protein
MIRRSPPPSLTALAFGVRYEMVVAVPSGTYTIKNTITCST